MYCVLKLECADAPSFKGHFGSLGSLNGYVIPAVALLLMYLSIVWLVEERISDFQKATCKGAAGPVGAAIVPHAVTVPGLNATQ